jgi:hypothetical protein
MIEWVSNGFVCGSGGCEGTYRGECCGVPVEASIFSRKGRTEKAYRIAGGSRLYATEEALEEACRAQAEGRHGEHYLEVARLRSLCIRKGIDPDGDE